jgi:hypothetical protein
LGEVVWMPAFGSISGHGEEGIRSALPRAAGERTSAECVHAIARMGTGTAKAQTIVQNFFSEYGSGSGEALEALGRAISVAEFFGGMEQGWSSKPQKKRGLFARGGQANAGECAQSYLALLERREDVKALSGPEFKRFADAIGAEKTALCAFLEAASAHGRVSALARPEVFARAKSIVALSNAGYEAVSGYFSALADTAGSEGALERLTSPPCARQMEEIGRRLRFSSYFDGVKSAQGAFSRAGAAHSDMYYLHFLGIALPPGEGAASPR